MVSAAHHLLVSLIVILENNAVKLFRTSLIVVGLDDYSRNCLVLAVLGSQSRTCPLAIRIVVVVCRSSEVGRRVSS